MYAAGLLFYQEQTNSWTFIFSDVLRTMFSEIAEGWLDGCLCHWLFYFLIEISNSSPVQKEWYLHCELVSRKTVGLWLIPCSFTKEINSSLIRDHSFSTYAKFSEKLIFYTHTHVKIYPRTKWMTPYFLGNFLAKICQNSYRNSRSQMFFKIGVLENFAKFTGQHLCWSLFLETFQAVKPVTFLKRVSSTCVFLWIFLNF